LKENLGKIAADLLVDLSVCRNAQSARRVLAVPAGGHGLQPGNRQAKCAPPHPHPGSEFGGQFLNRYQPASKFHVQPRRFD
jgi:hypothetical protein